MSEKLPEFRKPHYFWHGPALKDSLEVDGDEIVTHRLVGRRTAQNAPRSKHFTRVSVRAAACGRGVDVQPTSRRRPDSFIVDVNGTVANGSVTEVVCIP